MATYTQILMSAAALAAVVPMAHSARGSWFSRIADRFRRSEPKQAVADPPSIPNDAGWQLIHSENADSFEAWLLKDQSGLPLGSSEQPSLGSHLLIELFDCDQTSLEKVSTVGKAMRDAATATTATSSTATTIISSAATSATSSIISRGTGAALPKGAIRCASS